jgi:hypothetical protein
MKNKIIIAATALHILLGMKVMAQKVQKLNNDISVVLAQPIKQLNADGIEKFASNNNIKYNKSYEGLKDRAVYAIDGMIFTSVKMNTPQKRDLDKLKKGLDALSQSAKTKSYSSKIIESNGYRIFLATYKDLHQYHFTAVDSSGKSAMTGVLDFSDAKKEAAKKLLDSIIESLKF